MSKYLIELDSDTETALKLQAESKGLTLSEYAAHILNKFAVSPHTMNEKDLAEGYESMGELNKEWAELK